MRILTRGRLVPRQPRAIKRTTRTELRDENIRSDRCVHWNIGIIPTALHRCNIRNNKFVHWNIDITPTALHHEYIHNGKFVHWNNSAIPTALHRYNIHYAKYIHRQTITTQMILATNEIYIVGGRIGNNEPVDIKQENNMTQTTG